MNKTTPLLFLAIFLHIACSSSNNEKNRPDIPINNPLNVTFFSDDSLEVFANLYEHNSSSPTIVLCHQARFNKSEYFQIAKKLHKRGFNCLAIDQRSGGNVMDFENETILNGADSLVSFENNREGFAAAEKDIEAAINYAFQKYQKPIILWGSSYSSTLALYIAVQNEKVEAVLSFSPGLYLNELKGPLDSVLIDFSKPLFVTSSKREAAGENGVDKVVANIQWNDKQVQFVPKEEGSHGSRALWITTPNNSEYWKALDEFLLKIN